MPDTPRPDPEPGAPVVGVGGAPPPIPVTMDRDGNWFHEGLPILHAGLRRLLDRSLVITEDGAVEVQVGKPGRLERAIVTVEELPYQVRDVQALKTGRLRVTLNDEQVEEISPEALAIVGDDALYCRVKAGRYPARFLRHPYIRLASRFEEDGQGGFVLPLGGERWPIHQLSEAPTWPEG